MKQTTLVNLSPKYGLSPRTKVVDLFCGVGGFSCGAKQAGHELVLAVDNDPFMLGAHVRNHPECEHICCSMPCELPLPTSGEWHLHASPPCTKLSIMRPVQVDHEKKQALGLVEWFLDLVQMSNPTSWSMEEVNCPGVRRLLDALKARRPFECDYVVVNAVDYDVPQTRRRLIAGSPFLVANLRSGKSTKRRACVLDVVPNPPAQFIRNNLYFRPDPKTGERYKVARRDQMRPVTDPCYTILSTGHKRFCDENGKTVRHVNAREGALIQSFPVDYRLPFAHVSALVGVGNAVPPKLARVWMRPTRQPREPRDTSATRASVSDSMSPT